MPSKKQTIYLETSVISAYFDFKKQDAERKKITKKFWRENLLKFDVIISDVVIVELGKQEERAKEFLNVVAGFRRVEETKRSIRLSKLYLQHGIVRKTKPLDASHLALATDYKVDFLVSWNYKDFVSPEQRRKITEFNKKRKLSTPTIVTPYDFVA